MLARSRDLRTPIEVTGSLARLSLLGGLIALVIGTVALQSAGFLSLMTAITLLFAPLLLIAAGFRPGWVVLLLIAIPPALLNPIRPLMLLLLVVGTLLAQIVMRGTLFVGVRSGLWPLALLIGASFVFEASVGANAAFAASTFLKQFGYYVALSAVAYNAVRLGDLRRDHLINALLVGMFGTALFKIGFTGLGPVPHEGGTAAFYAGRSFAYLAVIGFSVAFARWMVRRSEGNTSSLDFALAAFFLLLVATSLVRGAWLSALLTLLVVAWYTGRRSYWLLVPLALALVLAVPVAAERVGSGPSGPIDITTGRWDLWTLLWEDHIVPALPLGNGFGHAWSLDPESVFGFRTFVFSDVPSDRFLYPHNDFLFWMIEFGLWGLILWVFYWVHLTVVTRRLLKIDDLAGRADALILVGILTAMFIAQLVANAYAIRPLAERFFVAAGFLYGSRVLSNLRRERQLSSEMMGSQKVLASAVVQEDSPK